MVVKVGRQAGNLYVYRAKGLFVIINCRILAVIGPGVPMQQARKTCSSTTSGTVT